MTTGARQTQVGHERLGRDWHTGSLFSLFVFTVQRQVDLVTLLALMSILHQISLAREKLASYLIQIALGCYRQIVCFFASLSYQ